MNENQILICTSGKGKISLHTEKINKKYSVPKIESVSTIGAGDNFNAGLIYSLFKMKIRKQDIASLEIKQWDKIINIGVDFAIDVCKSYDNFISKEFAENV